MIIMMMIIMIMISIMLISIFVIIPTTYTNTKHNENNFK